MNSNTCPDKQGTDLTGFPAGVKHLPQRGGHATGQRLQIPGARHLLQQRDM